MSHVTCDKSRIVPAYETDSMLQALTSC
jgi:hypothetical protein